MNKNLKILLIVFALLVVGFVVYNYLDIDFLISEAKRRNFRKN